MQSITINKLKELERIEYQELTEIQSLAYEYTEDGKDTTTIRQDIDWKRGRWGMLVDLIEELENNKTMKGNK